MYAQTARPHSLPPQRGEYKPTEVQGPPLACLEAKAPRYDLTYPAKESARRTCRLAVNESEIEDLRFYRPSQITLEIATCLAGRANRRHPVQLTAGVNPTVTLVFLFAASERVKTSLSALTPNRT